MFVLPRNSDLHDDGSTEVTLPVYDNGMGLGSGYQHGTEGGEHDGIACTMSSLSVSIMGDVKQATGTKHTVVTREQKASLVNVFARGETVCFFVCVPQHVLEPYAATPFDVSNPQWKDEHALFRYLADPTCPYKPLTFADVCASGNKKAVTVCE